MRNISAALTKDQIRESASRHRLGLPPIKDVTRRLGWLNLKPGELLQFCDKCQGIKPGEKMVRICAVRVISVRREKLNRLTVYPDYGRKEVRREGFEHDPAIAGDPEGFVKFFCATHKGCTPKTKVTRIVFEYLHPLAVKITPAVQLAQVKQAIHEYHHALDTRQHGTLAMDQCLNKIQTILNLLWVRGATIGLTPDGDPK